MNTSCWQREEWATGSGAPGGCGTMKTSHDSRQWWLPCASSQQRFRGLFTVHSSLPGRYTQVYAAPTSFPCQKAATLTCPGSCCSSHWGRIWYELKLACTICRKWYLLSHIIQNPSSWFHAGQASVFSNRMINLSVTDLQVIPETTGSIEPHTHQVLFAIDTCV